MKLFWKRAAALTGMTTAGQLVLVLVSPIIARLFKPEEFGSYAVALALATIFVAISTLRFSLAQTTARSAYAADGLFIICAVILLIITSLASIAALLASRVSITGDGYLLDPQLVWGVPVACLFMGLVEVLSFRSIRQNDFRTLSLTKTIIPASVALFQVLSGLGKMGAIGLLMANIAGNAIGSLILLPKSLSGLKVPKRRRYYILLIARFKNFPLFSAPTALLDTIAFQLIPLMLAGFFGEAVAGQFALVHRVLKQPTTLLGLSLSQAFLAEAQDAGANRKDGIRQFALSTLKKLSLVATVLALMGIVFSPWLFVTAFGPRWTQAGQFAQILIPLYFALFLYAPFHQILTIREKQHLNLAIEGSRLVAVVVLLSCGAIGGLQATGTLMLYSAGVTAVYLAGTAIVIRTLKKEPLS